MRNNNLLKQLRDVCKSNNLVIIIKIFNRNFKTDFLPKYLTYTSNFIFQIFENTISTDFLEKLFLVTRSPGTGELFKP